ncbi:MAG TPA: hypothetical protein VNT26_23775 [Candidatus Sulfotelmatobacter sp.]|nr:hypothetical protein [Candidatus Sulfotelmatobacter sp.]
MPELQHIFTDSGRRVLEDPHTKTKFRRIIGGIGWPFSPTQQPGALVVLGEELYPDRHFDRHHVRVLIEAELPDKARNSVDDLLSMVLGAREDYFCWEWRGETDNPNKEFLRRLNNRLVRSSMGRLQLRSFPKADMPEREWFSFADQLVYGRISGQKTLHFGEFSRIPETYKTYRKDIGRIPVRELPLIAAFLYALSEIDMRPFGGDARPSTYEPADPVGGY